MKLISLNTWGCRITEPIYEFIKKYSESTDIFCFQEILKNGNGKTHREEIKNSYEQICSLLPDYNGYFCEYGENGYYSENSSNLDFQFGVACFIKSKLKQNFIGNNVLYDLNKKWSDYDGGFAVGTAMAIEVEDYSILNIHGLWQGSIKTDTEAKIEQSRKIIELANKTHGKKIICGDFNLLPNTRSIEMLDKRYNNLIKKYNIINTRSSFYTKENRFADFVFTSPETKVSDFKVLPDEVSDHLPLFLDFE